MGPLQARDFDVYLENPKQEQNNSAERMKLYPMYLKRGGTRKNQDLEVKSTIKRVEK